MNFQKGKKENYFFNHIFNLSPYRFTQISSVGTTVGCIIKFFIQRVPTLHTFDRPTVR
jgi:hypothetical protein